MKAGSEKSSVTTSTSARQPSNQPFFAKAGGGNFFTPTVSTAAPAVQMKMTVNKPGDALEQEADKTADKVMRMPAPPAPAREDKLQRQPGDKLQKKAEDKIQKAPAPEEQLRKKEDDTLRKAPAPEEKIGRKEDETVRRKGDNVPAVSSDTQSAIRSRTGGGQPLSGEVRSFMEPRFGADFSNVRIHHDAEAARLSNRLSARAFTYQNHVFFSRGQYQPGTSEGRQLLAHELTHTIQQGHAVQRSPQVSATATAPPIQRLGVSDALEYFAEAAYNIPGFRMFTVVVGVNPITMQRTDRSAANILRAVVELWPGGHLVTRVLDHYGVLERAGGFVEQQLNGLGVTGSSIRAAITRFLDSLSWTDIVRLGSVWERAKAIFTEPITRIGNLIRGLFNAIKGFVWDAVLRPLAGLAAQTRGYDLLKAVLGRDPITGEAYPRTAETLIGGFMKLIGQEEVWENIKRGNAVGRAWAWFQGALAGLMDFVGQIPALFMRTLRSLELPDFLVITNAFRRIAGAFGNFVGNFITWAGSKVMGLLEILFSVVAPGVMPFIRRAAGAFQQILRNPVRFVGNLVRAGMQGFRSFAGNILTHLRAGLIGWLTGALTGLTLPARWDFRGILSLVLQVLGLTWPQVRGRLVRVLGEPTMGVLERTFGLVMTLVREGPVAAWRELMGHLGNLQEMIFGQIREWIRNTIVGQAVMRIASMLNPAGAVVQAIIAIYNTIMFFVERMRQIGAVVESVVNSMSAIAAGAIGPAANANHLSDSDVTVAGQPVSFILPVTKKADHQRANRPVAGTAAPLDADFIRNHSGWIALLGILSALSLVSVILHVGAYAQNALAARKKRLSANAPSAIAHSAHGSPLPDDLLREVNRNVSRLNTSLRAVQGGALAAAASKQGGTASVPQTHRYFLCELMMTAGPRKKFMNEPNADLDLGEDVCGLIAGSQRVFVWVLDGTSDLHCMRNPANGREYFSSRLLAQGVANQLRKLTGEKPALPLEEMVHQAIEGVRADWLVAINQLPDEEKQSLRKNIKSKNFPECASTLLAGQLTLHGDLLAYRSGDSKMVLFAATPAGPIRAIPTSLAGKNEAANDRIFFRLVLDAHDHLTIQMNQPAYEIIRQQNIAALIAFSDGIGASTEHLLKNEYEVQPAEARSELICQVQGTADDKSICFIEIKESELPGAPPASTG